jgi:hypothetical protein
LTQQDVVTIVLTTVEDLRTALLTRQPLDFVSRFLLEPIPHAFEDDLDLWISWKTTLAGQLGVDPYEMVLTGSAAVGFSLNPFKRFKEYDLSSDIDVGVISLHHFELAWRYLRQSHPSWLSLPADTRRALASHRKYYIFEGTIATDLVLPLLPFGQRWQAGLDMMAAIPPTVNRVVKMRIYRDFAALRAYHAFGVTKLREQLISPVESETTIGTEEVDT